MSKKKKNTPHDALLKTLMNNPIAAKEFLEEYLPEDFKSKVNLNSIKVEKESYVDEKLTKYLSDIVLSVKTKDNKKAFIYTLIEGQTSSDYWISLRLWKYMLLLSERHQTKAKKKLPIICPIVLYHGSRKYNAPLNLWELYQDPKLAKELMTSNYQLVDLQAMQNDEINYDKHLSIMLHLMKHIHLRDKFKLVKNIFKNCYKAIIIDEQNDYIYIRLMIWYIDSKIPSEKKRDLEQLIIDHLPKEKGEKIMHSIADLYIEKGIEKGIQQGMQQGIEKGRQEGRHEGIETGIEKGRQEAIEKTAIRMLQEKLELKLIAAVTGLSTYELLKLQTNNQVTS